MKSVAVYWDFENIHISAGKNSQTPKGKSDQGGTNFEVEVVMNFARELGNVSIVRAYADWTSLGAYKESLLAENVDLIQLFPRGQNAKNGADIRLVADAIGDLNQHRHLTTVVVVSGDSDFTALAQHVQRAGIELIGIAVEGSASKYWINACDDFRYYHSLLPTPEVVEAGGKSSEPRVPKETMDLLTEVIQGLSAGRPDGKALLAPIHTTMKKRDRTFEPKNFGYKNMPDMLRAYPALFSLEKGENDWRVSVQPPKTKKGV